MGTLRATAQILSHASRRRGGSGRTRTSRSKRSLHCLDLWGTWCTTGLSCAKAAPSKLGRIMMRPHSHFGDLNFTARSGFVAHLDHQCADLKPSIPKVGRLSPHSHLEIVTFWALSTFVGHSAHHRAELRISPRRPSGRQHALAALAFGYWHRTTPSQPCLSRCRRHRSGRRATMGGPGDIGGGVARRVSSNERRFASIIDENNRPGCCYHPLRVRVRVAGGRTLLSRLALASPARALHARTYVRYGQDYYEILNNSCMS